MLWTLKASDVASRYGFIVRRSNVVETKKLNNVAYCCIFFSARACETLGTMEPHPCYVCWWRQFLGVLTFLVISELLIDEFVVSEEYGKIH